MMGNSGPKRLRTDFRTSTANLDITTVLVCSLVRKGRKKGADKIPMSHMKLNTVSTRFLDPFGCISECLCGLFNFFGGELMWNVGFGRIWAGRNRDGRWTNNGASRH
jgi:hypothetical protein